VEDVPVNILQRKFTITPWFVGELFHDPRPSGFEGATEHINLVGEDIAVEAATPLSAFQASLPIKVIGNFRRNKTAMIGLLTLYFFQGEFSEESSGGANPPGTEFT